MYSQNNLMQKILWSFITAMLFGAMISPLSAKRFAPTALSIDLLSSISPSSDARPPLNSTEFYQTVQSVFGIDPLHTPRQIIILTTPTLPASSTSIVQTTPSFSVTPTGSSEFRVSVEGGSLPLERMCVFINLKHFVPSDSEISSSSYYLVRHSKITVDESVIYTSQDFWISTIDYIEYAVNEQGTPTGSYFSPLTICVDTNELEPGTHAARLEITIGQESIYTYIWEFTIN